MRIPVYWELAVVIRLGFGLGFRVSVLHSMNPLKIPMSCPCIQMGQIKPRHFYFLASRWTENCLGFVLYQYTALIQEGKTDQWQKTTRVAEVVFVLSVFLSVKKNPSPVCGWNSRDIVYISSVVKQLHDRSTSVWIPWWTVIWGD